MWNIATCRKCRNERAISYSIGHDRCACHHLFLYLVSSNKRTFDAYGLNKYWTYVSTSLKSCFSNLACLTIDRKVKHISYKTQIRFCADSFFFFVFFFNSFIVLWYNFYEFDMQDRHSFSTRWIVEYCGYDMG